MANFSVLTDKVLALAVERATRPVDIKAVLASADKAGAVVAAGAAVATGAALATRVASGRSVEPEVSLRRFVESTQRMVRILERPPDRERSDPGSVLIDLLGFADAVTASQPARPFEPLEYPVLAHLTGPRLGGAGVD